MFLLFLCISYLHHVFLLCLWNPFSTFFPPFLVASTDRCSHPSPPEEPDLPGQPGEDCKLSLTVDRMFKPVIMPDMFFLETKISLINFLWIWRLSVGYFDFARSGWLGVTKRITIRCIILPKTSISEQIVRSNCHPYRVNLAAFTEKCLQGLESCHKALKLGVTTRQWASVPSRVSACGLLATSHSQPTTCVMFQWPCEGRSFRCGKCGIHSIDEIPQDQKWFSASSSHRLESWQQRKKASQRVVLSSHTLCTTMRCVHTEHGLCSRDVLFQH